MNLDGGAAQSVSWKQALHRFASCKPFFRSVCCGEFQSRKYYHSNLLDTFGCCCFFYWHCSSHDTLANLLVRVFSCPAQKRPSFHTFKLFITFTFRIFSRRFYRKKYICQKKEKQYIVVGTVQIFIETSAKRLELLGRLTHSLYTTKIGLDKKVRIRRYTMKQKYIFKGFHAD